MAIGVVDADADVGGLGTSSTTHALEFPTAVAVGRLLYVGINSRDGDGTITSVVGAVSTQEWTLLSGPVTNEARTWTYYTISTGAGTETVTVTFSTAVLAALAVAQGTGTDIQLDTVDATPAANASGTAHVSDAVTPGANGLAIGFLGLSGDQDVTAVGTDETDVTNEALRSHIITQAATAGVGVSLDATLDGNRTSHFHLAVFREGAAAGAAPRRQSMALLGCG